MIPHQWPDTISTRQTNFDVAHTHRILTHVTSRYCGFCRVQDTHRKGKYFWKIDQRLVAVGWGKLQSDIFSGVFNLSSQRTGVFVWIKAEIYVYVIWRTREGISPRKIWGTTDRQGPINNYSKAPTSNGGIRSCMLTARARTRMTGVLLRHLSWLRTIQGRVWKRGVYVGALIHMHDSLSVFCFLQLCWVRRDASHFKLR